MTNTKRIVLGMIPLASLRARLVWSQEDMAKYLDCSQPTIDRMEGGQRVSGPIARLIARLEVLVEAGKVTPDMAVADVVVLAVGEAAGAVRARWGGVELEERFDTREIVAIEGAQP